VLGMTGDQVFDDLGGCLFLLALVCLHHFQILVTTLRGNQC